VQPFAKLEAHDEVAPNALSDGAAAAPDLRGDAYLVVTGVGTGRVLVHLNAAERRIQQDLGAVAFLVAVVEELRDHNSVRVRDEGSRIGDSVQQGVTGLDLIVQDPVLTDDRGVEIRQQGVGDLLLVAELRQRLQVIVGDGVELDSCRFEVVVRVAQLAELRPARRSPDRRAIEHDDRG
jgi:hypothetical protein